MEETKNKVIAKHITEKKNLQAILNQGLRPKDGYVYLYEEGTIFNPQPFIIADVRDIIAYDQLFLCENEEAVELTIDITEYSERGEVYGESCYECTEKFHRLVKSTIPPDKIISHKTFKVKDVFKNNRPYKSNNKMQKTLKKSRHKRGDFERNVFQLPPATSAN